MKVSYSRTKCPNQASVITSSGGSDRRFFIQILTCRFAITCFLTNVFDNVVNEIQMVGGVERG